EPGRRHDLGDRTGHEQSEAVAPEFHPSGSESFSKDQTMRHLSFLILIIVLLTCGPAQAAQPPHIVMYLSDDHGIDFVGCYGNDHVKTPNIDRLAREGVKFTRMFAASPTCTPSRSVIYTGLYPARNGAMGNHTTTRPGVRSLPHYLRPLGYRVVLANKVH